MKLSTLETPGENSRYTDQAAGWTNHKTRYDCREQQGHFPRNSRVSLGHLQPAINWQEVSQGIERLRSEADNSSLSKAKNMNELNSKSTPSWLYLYLYLYIFRGYRMHGNYPRFTKASERLDSVGSIAIG